MLTEAILWIVELAALAAFTLFIAVVALAVM